LAIVLDTAPLLGSGTVDSVALAELLREPTG
jgi:hypothetical protein